MSNKSSDSLHRLIKALSKPEKRYFKIYANRHTLGQKNNYLVLFDAIDKQEVYDEAALKEYFAIDNNIKKFSISKSRLYDAILKALDGFHANSSIDAQLKKTLHSVEILYKKTLYDLAYKMLLSARRMATKFDKHTSLLEIQMWEKLLIEKGNYQDTDEEALIEMRAENNLVLQKIANYNEFWSIKSRLFHMLNRRGKPRTKKEFEEFKSIIDDTLLRSEDKALYHETKYLYNHIYSAYYFGIGNYPECYKHLVRNVEYIESLPEKFKEEPNVYFSVLTNTIYVGSQLRKFDEVFEYLQKLRSMPEDLSLGQNEDLDIKLFSSAYSIELTLYAVMGEFEKGVELIPIVEDGLKLYDGKLSNLRKAAFFIAIAIIYFGAGDMSNSLKWTNRVMNDIDISESEDIYCFAQMMNLIIHLELGNQRLVPYAMKSAQRYLKVKNRRYKFESTMHGFLSKVLRMEHQLDFPELCEELYLELKDLESDPFERAAFEYFDFCAWAEAKAYGKSFVDVVKAKASQLPPGL